MQRSWKLPCFEKYSKTSSNAQVENTCYKSKRMIPLRPRQLLASRKVQLRGSATSNTLKLPLQVLLMSYLWCARSKSKFLIVFTVYGVYATEKNPQHSRKYLLPYAAPLLHGSTVKQQHTRLRKNILTHSSRGRNILVKNMKIRFYSSTDFALSCWHLSIQKKTQNIQFWSVKCPFNKLLSHIFSPPSSPIKFQFALKQMTQFDGILKPKLLMLRVSEASIWQNYIEVRCAHAKEADLYIQSLFFLINLNILKNVFSKCIKFREYPKCILK